MKKVLCVLLVVVTLFSTGVTVFSANIEESNNQLLGYNIIFYETGTNIESNGTTPNIVVLSEEQLLHLGSQTKELFDDVSILYVLTGMSVSEIQEVCDIQATISSDVVQDLKFATAIMKDADGNYVFNNVSALYMDTSVNNKARTVSDISTTQKVYDGLYSVLKTKEEGLNTVDGTKARMQATGFCGHSSDSVVLYDSSNNRIGTMGYTTYWYQVVKSGTNRIFDVIALLHLRQILDISVKG